MNLDERVVSDPETLVGKPRVKGTRLSVEFIKQLVAAEWSREQILRNYPGLVDADIEACIAYVLPEKRN